MSDPSYRMVSSCICQRIIQLLKSCPPLEIFLSNTFYSLCVFSLVVDVDFVLVYCTGMILSELMLETRNRLQNKKFQDF